MLYRLVKCHREDNYEQTLSVSRIGEIHAEQIPPINSIVIHKDVGYQVESIVLAPSIMERSVLVVSEVNKDWLSKVRNA